MSSVVINSVHGIKTCKPFVINDAEDVDAPVDEVGLPETIVSE